MNITNEELTPDQRFHDPTHKNIVMASIRLLTTNPIALARSRGMELDDLKQHGYEGFWKACLKYDESSNYEFSTYAIHAIKWHLMDLLNHNREGLIKYTVRTKHADKNEVYSMDMSIDSSSPEDTYHDLIGNEDNGYNDKIAEIQFNEYMQNMTEKQRQVAELKFADYSDPEISKILNISRQRVGQTRIRIKEKLKGRLYA